MSHVESGVLLSEKTVNMKVLKNNGSVRLKVCLMFLKRTDTRQRICRTVMIQCHQVRVMFSSSFSTASVRGRGRSGDLSSSGTQGLYQDNHLMQILGLGSARSPSVVGRTPCM